MIAEYTKQKRVVALPIFICCIVLCTLIGLGAGLMLMTADRVNQSTAQLEQGTQSAAPMPKDDKNTADIQPPAVEPSTGGSTVHSSTFARPEGYTKAQVVEMSAPSVVGIDVIVKGNSFFYGEYEAPASGSGVILTGDGYIATNNHVVSGASSITVTLNDDTEHEARLIGTDSRNDIAIIKIEGESFIPATIGDSNMLTVGDEVIAIGNPLGELRGTATDGIISAVKRAVNIDGTEMELIQTNAAISPGNSGGGLFDSNGRLIGIVNAKVSASSAEGLGFAIPINSVLTEINELMTQGYVSGRAQLGIYTQDVTIRGGFYFFGGTNCVQITDVIKDGAADKAGLLVGDLILKLDDYTIGSNSELATKIAEYNAGDTVTLLVQRGNEQLSIQVTFTEFKPQD